MTRALQVFISLFLQVLLCLLSCRRSAGYSNTVRPYRGTRLYSSTTAAPKLTAAQQFARAKREAEQQLKEERIQRDYHAHLDAIADGDDDAIKSMGGIEEWRKFAAPGITISPDGYAALPDTRREMVLDGTTFNGVNATLDFRGFAKVPPELLKWDDFDVDFPAISETMSNIVANGWPPVFIFLYDQPWKMMLRLFDLMQPLLGDDEATLEASMAAWALEKPERVERGSGAVVGKERVGNNFGVPHRDITYKNCHDPITGGPHILSLWIPVTEVSLNNGCMYVIPRECDPQFSRDEAKSDQDPFSHRFPYAHVTPLGPSPAGTVNVWHPNLIHWGGACSSESSLPPRKSIAMAFRVRDSVRQSTDKEIDRYGRLPFSRKELLQGGPDYKARLRMICKSLIMYNVWYPTYDGFEISKLDNTKAR